jgi:hypothetical protein
MRIAVGFDQEGSHRAQNTLRHLRPTGVIKVDGCDAINLLPEGWKLRA